MPAGTAPAVEVTDLIVRYGSDGEVTAVDRLSLSAHAGEAMLGIGFSGPKRWVNRMTGSLPRCRAR